MKVAKKGEILVDMARKSGSDYTKFEVRGRVDNHVVVRHFNSKTGGYEYELWSDQYVAMCRGANVIIKKKVD